MLTDAYSKITYVYNLSQYLINMPTKIPLLYVWNSLAGFSCGRVDIHEPTHSCDAENISID